MLKEKVNANNNCGWFGLGNNSLACPLCGHSVEKHRLIKPWGFAPRDGKNIPETRDTQEYSTVSIPSYSSMPQDISRMKIISTTGLLKMENRENQQLVSDLKCGYRIRYGENCIYADIYLYDSLSSGAGYSTRVADLIDNVLNGVEQRLESCTCETSCPKCIQHFWNQSVRESLDRKAGLQLLRWVRNGILDNKLSKSEQREYLSILDAIVKLQYGDKCGIVEQKGDSHFQININGKIKPITVYPAMCAVSSMYDIDGAILVPDRLFKVALSNAWKIVRENMCSTDALLQKTITVDFLTHKRIINKGHVQQYYVENSHPPIISKETFERTQQEMERRRKLSGVTDENRSRHSNKYAFSGKIICGECGSRFRRIRWGQGEKYKKYMWICRNRDEKGPEGCSIKAVDEEKLKKAFVRMVNRQIKDTDKFLSRMLGNIEKVFTNKANSVDVTAIDKRLDELREEMERLVRLNVKANLDTDIYGEEYARITDEMEELRQQRAVFTQAEFKRKDALSRVREIEKMLRGQELLKEFDEDLFAALVEQIQVKSLVEVVFVLKTGLEVREIL